LSRGVQVAGATWRAATRIMTGVGDLAQRTGDGQAWVGYSVAGQSGGQVTPCVVCAIHMEMRSKVFWLRLKTKGEGFSVWPSKSADPVW
jgi:hypothetical protein